MNTGIKREKKSGKEARDKIIQATESLYRADREYHTRKEILAHAGLDSQCGYHFTKLTEEGRIGFKMANGKSAVYCPLHISEALEVIEDSDTLCEGLEKAVDTMVLILRNMKSKEAERKDEVDCLRRDNEHLRADNSNYRERMANLKKNVMDANIL